MGSERVRTTWRGQSMFRGMAVSADKVGVREWGITFMVNQEDAKL